MKYNINCDIRSDEVNDIAYLRYKIRNKIWYEI